MLARRALLAAGHTEVAGGRGRAARDQHVLHHRRGGGEVAPVGAPLAERPPAGCSSPAARSTSNAAQFARDRRPRERVRRHRRGGGRRRWRGEPGRVRRPRARRPGPPAARSSRRAAGARRPAPAASSRSRTAATATAPTASSRPSGAPRARARRRAVLEEARRRVEQGQPEMVMTGISVGDYRDPDRGLELGELMVEVAQVPRRRARAALERRGDPRQGLAARGARHRAQGVPAPARADAVRRRRRC